MKIKVTLILTLVALLLVPASFVFSQEKMSMDEYKVQLAASQKTEADNTARIATLEAENADLRKQIDETQGQIDAVWAEIYAMLGTDKSGVESYRAELNDIGAKLDELSALSAEDLLARKDEIKDLQNRLAAAKSSKIAILTEFEKKIAEIDAKLAGLSTKLMGVYDQYTVVKGDYLWKIAKKPDIYGDAYQWIRIYCVNRDQIKNPDKIEPEQILNIQRTLGQNQYLVVKGDYLKKIAGSPDVLGDPTQWTKVYEANKDIVSDPNKIYPWQVLSIPKN
jgi:nucleoid-associated protein YgaU